LIDKIIEDAENDELFFGFLCIGLGVGMLLDNFIAGALLGIGFWIIIRYLKKDL